VQIETWALSKIKPYPKNARRIPQSAIDKVALSLREFGWKQPMVVEPDGTLIVGHVRYAGALQNEWTEGPVVVAHDLTPAQVKAYRLMDNRSHDEAKWELELAGAELLELKELNFDLAATGFSIGEIGRMLPATQPEPEAQTDRAEELLAKWKVERGQIWDIGNHRMMCGDSTARSDVTRLLNGCLPILMVTDPPYGVDYDPSWREENSRRRQAEGHKEWFGYNKGAVANDGRVDWAEAWNLFPGDVAYVWHAGIYAGAVAESLKGFTIRAQIIWRKQVAVFGRGAYHWGHEPCWYAVRDGRTAHWIGDHTQSTVWDVANLNPVGGNRDETKVGHSTQKPVELMRRAIANHDAPEVYDPFLGSGSTMVAAEQLGRKCYGMEIEPKYCAVILERMKDMGLIPQLQGL
jgi:DNA modification methylase